MSRGGWDEVRGGSSPSIFVSVAAPLSRRSPQAAQTRREELRDAQARRLRGPANDIAGAGWGAEDSMTANNTAADKRTSREGSATRSTRARARARAAAPPPPRAAVSATCRRSCQRWRRSVAATAIELVIY